MSNIFYTSYKKIYLQCFGGLLVSPLEKWHKKVSFSCYMALSDGKIYNHHVDMKKGFLKSYYAVLYDVLVTRPIGN